MDTTKESMSKELQKLFWKVALSILMRLEIDKLLMMLLKDS